MSMRLSKSTFFECQTSITLVLDREDTLKDHMGI